MKAANFLKQFENMSVGMTGNVLSKTSAVLLLTLLAFPFAVEAQVDDIYFVPKKQKEKVLVVKSVTEKYVVDDDATLRDVDEYNRRSVGYTDDPEYYIEENLADEYVDDEYNDYDYSTRIIRFRSPNRALGSSIYWDLSYGCGLNDWMVVDNGYSIDIYPTVNNPLYVLGASSYVWNSLNFYNWRDFYNRYYWNYPIYGHRHYPYYYDYFACHGHDYFGHYNYYYNPHSPHYYDKYYSTLYRPRRNTSYVPTNGAVAGGGRPIRNDKPIVNSGRVDRGDKNNGRPLNGNRGNSDLKVTNKRNDRGVAVQNKNGKTQGGNVNLRDNGSGNGRTRGNATVRDNRHKEFRVGSRADMGNNNSKGGNSVQNGKRTQPQVRDVQNNNRSRGVNVSGGRARGNSGANSVNRQENGSVSRRTPSSSGGYNRPSSTSVSGSRSSGNSGSSYSSGSTRSRSGNSGSSYSRGGSNTRSSSSGSSYSRGGSNTRSSSSSYSSGGSSRSSSSSYSSGGSSRSSSSGSSGSSSRSSGGGRSR